MTLGISLPMLVGEPLLTYRFGRVQETVHKAVSKGVRITVGYALLLLVVGVVREWLSLGTVFGAPVGRWALLPLAKAGVLKGDVVINAITGSTGAGVKPQPTTHFSWRNGNMSVYKVFTHQHLLEINQSIREFQPDFGGDLDFVPYRGDFARGIFTTVFMRTGLSQEEIDKCYSMYAGEPFTHYVSRDIDLKQVVNTNRALVHAQKYGDRLLVTSVIDNLLKGAAGQAVENMNIMFGIAEDAGLKLKAAAF